MIVLNVDLIILLMLKVDFVLKFVVTEKDILQIVMMEIMLMVMDAVEIVKLKLVSHAMVVHLPQKTAALLFFLQPYQLNQEANQDFMERLF